MDCSAVFLFPYEQMFLIFELHYNIIKAIIRYKVVEAVRVTGAIRTSVLSDSFLPTLC